MDYVLKLLKLQDEGKEKPFYSDCERSQAPQSQRPPALPSLQ